jgi:hypothetical protein
MKAFYVVIAIAFFLLGFAISDMISGKQPVQESTANVDVPRQTSMVIFSPISGTDRASPGDHIKENQIHVYDGKVVIDADVEWSRFTDTKSMDPLFDSSANGLEMKPKSENDIRIGDIIVYNYNDKRIIHRVIAKGQDNEGIYFTVKGDNNKDADGVKVRFKDITGILVGIIY